MAKASPLFCSSPVLDEALGELAADIRRGVGRGVVSPGAFSISLAIGRNRGAAPCLGSYRGNFFHYPASIVKTFFMAAAFAEIEAGRIAMTAELLRALRDMIALSSNDATHYIVDCLTGTTAGPELKGVSLRRWLERRRRVQDWFAGLGWPEWQSAVILQKTFEDGPYGREAQARAAPSSRNALSTDLVARLMWEIAASRMVSLAASRAMRRLLARDRSIARARRDPGNQVLGFFGEGLARLDLRAFYSKAGHTSWTRHDSAIIETRDGLRVVLVAFTLGQKAAQHGGLLPEIARRGLALARRADRLLP